MTTDELRREKLEDLPRRRESYCSVFRGKWLEARQIPVLSLCSRLEHALQRTALGIASFRLLRSINGGSPEYTDRLIGAAYNGNACSLRY